MKTLYSVTVKIAATAYIRAESQDEAERIFSDTFAYMHEGELPTGETGLTCVSGESFDSETLPDCSLSPAITFYGKFIDDSPIELAE